MSPFCETSAVDMLRHERMTVAAELSEALHPSRDVRSGLRTTHHGGRRHHLRWCGRTVSLSPGRRGVTAAGGPPQETPHPTLGLPVLSWASCEGGLLHPPLSHSLCAGS